MPCAGWKTLDFEIRPSCRVAARAAVAAAAPGLRDAELSVVLGDDSLLRRLNHEWRGQDKPTNVLSFPSAEFDEGTEVDPLPEESPLLLGDVILSYETVTAEALAQGKAVADHLRHLVIHGTLHLLGFDHEAEDEALRMEALETRILAGMGIADPYSPLSPGDDPMAEAVHHG